MQFVKTGEEREKQKDEHCHYGDNFTCESCVYPVTLSGSQYDNDYNDEAIGDGESARVFEGADRDYKGVYSSLGGYAEYI